MRKKSIKYVAIALLVIVITCALSVLLLACDGKETKVKEKKAIVMIHGFAAGALYDKETDKLLFDVNVDEIKGALKDTTKIVPLVNRYMNTLFTELAIEQDGTHDDNARPCTLNDPQGIYTMADVFKPLYEELTDEYDDGEYVIDIWQYDWRDSMADVAVRLEEYINGEGFDKVILISHSNGGQVVSSYLARSEQNRAKVELYVPIAAPFYGVTDTAYFMHKGNLANLNTLLSSIEIRKGVYAGELLESALIKPIVDGVFSSIKGNLLSYFGNMTSFYMLFPHEELFNAPYYTDTTVKKVGEKWLNYQEMMASYLSVPYCVYNDELKPSLKNLDTYYEKLYSNVNGEKVFITDLVNTYYICGVGKKTLISFEVDENGNLINSTNNTLGDGLVCQYSATLGRMTGDNILVVDDKDHLTIATCKETVNKIEHLIDELEGD